MNKPHGTLLLVDDDELVQNSTQALLAVLGHRVTPALTGEAALAGLEAGLKPDFVILDMNMPGLGGGGTLPRLRALAPDLPVLIATGRVEPFRAFDAARLPARAKWRISEDGTLLLYTTFSVHSRLFLVEGLK